VQKPRGRRVDKTQKKLRWESKQGELKDAPSADGSRCACIDAFKKESDIHGHHHQ
jgi:hypothetical protein